MKRIIWAILILSALTRLTRLNFYPLYSDEAAQGFNAYAIFKTGRDEFGVFLPTILRSFGDYKPALSSYLMIPFVFLGGLKEISVRLPSSILGILTLPIFYFFVRKKIPASPKIAFLALFILATAPWHIHLSRLSMLVSVELFFILTGNYFLSFLSKKKHIIGIIFLALSLYTYYGSRLTAPLYLFLNICFFQKKSPKIFLSYFLLFGLLIAPLFASILANPIATTSRERSVNILANQSTEGKLWEIRTFLDFQQNPKIINFFHKKISFYLADFSENLFKHFDIRFLFLSGDKAEPFQLWHLGQFFLVLLPFLFVGIYEVTKQNLSQTRYFFSYLAIAALPAALTIFTPAANRSFNMLVPLSIFIALGLGRFLSYDSRKAIIAFLLIFLLNFGYFYFSYYHASLQNLGSNYLFGNKEAVSKILGVENKYDKIVVTNMGGSYIYFLFYGQIDPEFVWKNRIINPDRDQFGYEQTEVIGKYQFRRIFDWEKENKSSKILFLVRDHEIPGKVPLGFNNIFKIYYPNGNVAYKGVDL